MYVVFECENFNLISFSCFLEKTPYRSNHKIITEALLLNTEHRSMCTQNLRRKPNSRFALEHIEHRYFHSHFFVTPNLTTSTMDGYGHQNRYEWLRMWRFEPHMHFISHAPPTLVHRRAASWNVLNNIRQDGTVFEHFMSVQ